MFDYVQSVVYTYLNTQLNEINSKTNSAYPSITYDSNRAMTRISDTTKLSRLLFNDDSIQTIAFTNSKNTIISNNLQSILDISQSLYNQSIDLTNIKSYVNTLSTTLNEKQPIIGLQNPISGSAIQYGNSTVSNEINYLKSNLGALQNMLSSKLDASGGVLMNPTFSGTKTGISKTTFGLSNVDNTSDANKPISTDMSNALSKKAPLVNTAFTGTITGLTKSTVNLSNVDNTADLDKPVSIDTSNALALKASLNGCTFTGAVYGITKSMVNLSNVDNTADIDKPISNAMNTALSKKAPISNPVFTGESYGITPSMVNLSNVNNTSDANRPVSTDLSNALKLKANLSGCTFTGPVYGITKSMVNLSNVNNVSDMNKPISNLEQTQLNTKMDLSGGTFAGDISTNGNIIFTSSSAQIKYFSSTNTESGKVLTSNSTGILSLVAPPGGSGTGDPKFAYIPSANGLTISNVSGSGSTNWINVTTGGLSLNTGNYLIFYKASVYSQNTTTTSATFSSLETCLSTNSSTSLVNAPSTGFNFTKHDIQQYQRRHNSSVLGEQNVLFLNVTVASTYYVFLKCSYVNIGPGMTNLVFSTSTGLAYSNGTTYIHAIKIS